ncbi:15285_t:CDS:2 [Acaulospora colombiana]|uniref:15285_t:CDS:1 n=1 Tax=Acaulospora colombiana TaxID=27376 RepID=A0ACA9PAN3_9GLOM|nr:15285_t:CDS:2 [Acaulospora colombiana]
MRRFCFCGETARIGLERRRPASLLVGGSTLQFENRMGVVHLGSSQSLIGCDEPVLLLVGGPAEWDLLAPVCFGS